MTPVSWLDTAEKLSRTLSIAAIPVVVAVGGWLIQRQLQDQTIKRDYVQLAVSILQNPDPSKVPPEIREWAVDLLNENAPTKLNARAMANLKSGTVTLSGFSFVPSSALTPELQKNLETSLQNFKAFLEKLGFQTPSETIAVKISPGTTINGQGVALWDPATHSILVASAFADDDVSVLRQFAHTLLAPSGGASQDYYAIESGLATYFPCSFTNSPMLGDKASAAGKAVLRPQNLRNRRKLSEIHADDWVSVQNDGSEVWGGALWEVRELLGPEAADRLIANTWQASSPPKAGRASVVFADNLVTNSRSIANGRYTGQIRRIFSARGLHL
jgi:hypothetical protein